MNKDTLCLILFFVTCGLGLGISYLFLRLTKSHQTNTELRQSLTEARRAWRPGQVWE